MMSLRDFIRATAKEIQDVATKKAASVEQPPLKQIEPQAIAAGTGTEEKEKIEKREPTSNRKKTKRGK